MSKKPHQNSHSEETHEATDRTTLRENLDKEWAELFPYPEVYDEQVSGIESVIETVGQNGYCLIEGACGTGKTALALVGCVNLLHDTEQTDQQPESKLSQFKRVFVSTPVKQQLSQFVEEMEAINAVQQGKPIPTVTVRGKGDLTACAQSTELLELSTAQSPQSPDSTPPSTHEQDKRTEETPGHGSADTVTKEPEQLQQAAKRLIKFDSQIPLDWPDGWSPPEYSKVEYNWNNEGRDAKKARKNYRFDPHRAEVVTELVRELGSDTNEGKGNKLEIEGYTSPYPEGLPRIQQVADFTRMDGQTAATQQGFFDPFFSGFFAGSPDPGYDFTQGVNHVLDREALVENSITCGVCPYESMKYFAQRAAVAIGNYNHVFDPQTRHLTSRSLDLLDEQTLLVVDEAHEIEERVRSMLSDSVRYQTLIEAETDLKWMRHLLEGDTEFLVSETNLKRGEIAAAQHSAYTGSGGVDPSEIATFEEIVHLVKVKLCEFTAEELTSTYDSVPETDQEAADWYPEESEIPLEEQPARKGEATAKSNGEGDKLLTALKKEGYNPAILEEAEQLFGAIKAGYDSLEDDGYDSRSMQTSVGRLLSRWVREDRVMYHRTIRLRSDTRSELPTEAPSWMSKLAPEYELFNCIPQEKLQDIFAELGGGILMSATIEPADIFMRAVGIDDVTYAPEIAHSHSDTVKRAQSNSEASQGKTDPATGEAEKRPLTYEQYSLRFPEKNRLSMVGLLPKFTSSNRGPVPDSPADEMSKTRKQYIEVIVEVATQPGNILLAFPNYSEAEWMCEVLKQRDIDKRLHLDQSSSSQETTQLLDSFFEQGDAVILTSSRGTITTGVDYKGEKLHSAAVVGISLLPVQIPRNQAIREAYGSVMTGESGFEAAFTVPAVRKARQTIGRVIRGESEVGTRLLIDKRYNSTDWDGVHKFLSPQQQTEFQPIIPEGLSRVLSAFWNDV